MKAETQGINHPKSEELTLFFIIYHSFHIAYTTAAHLIALRLSQLNT